MRHSSTKPAAFGKTGSWGRLSAVPHSAAEDNLLCIDDTTTGEPHLMENHQGTHGSYTKFFAMIGTSMVAMFFLMYLNSYEILGHARFSETRLFMTPIMGAAMMVIMLGMYKRSTVNVAIS